MKLHAVKVKNPSLGEFDGTTVRVSDDLLQRLEQSKTRDGTNLLDLLRAGRALKAFKHLLERIRHVDGNLVLTLEKSHRWGRTYYVNWDDYRKRATTRFYAFYRDTGLEIATSFLADAFPEHFTSDKLTATEVRRVRANVPDVVAALAEKEKHKRLMLRALSDQLAALQTKKLSVKRQLAELDALRRQFSVSYYTDRMKEFRTRLEHDHPETRGKDSWQRWIYANSWLFGVQYSTPIEKEHVGFGQIPDYLFPTLDGFIDILEIKKPTLDVLRADEGHPGSFVWSRETTSAVGQVVNYIDQLEQHRREVAEILAQKHGDLHEGTFSAIRPRAFVLIGRSEGWTRQEREAFRKLNYSLHGIEVMTYCDLLRRGDRTVAMYRGPSAAQQAAP